MKIDDVRKNAYSMPLTNPSFPPGPYRFFNREYFVIGYRTDPEALACRARPVPACARRRGATAGARGDLGTALQGRPDARPRQRRVRLSGEVRAKPACVQRAPLSVQEVVQVVVMPRSQAMQAATHCFMSLGLYDV